MGKTWLLKEFGKREFQDTHYVNFERNKRFCSLFNETLSPFEIVKMLEILLHVKVDTKKDFVIFDEIQECPAALTSLKYFKEEMPDLALGCAGSHIGIIANSSSYPVGKVDTITLFPMNFEEYLTVSMPELVPLFGKAARLENIPEEIHKLLWKELKNYFIVGGLPEAVSEFIESGKGTMESFGKVREIHEKLIEGYYSDFAKHSGAWNATHIASVWQNVPEQITRVLNESVSRFQFKGVIPNKSKYSQFAGPIDWLVRTGLVIPVYLVEDPAIPLRSRRKVNMLKLYLFDVGLMGTMAGTPIDRILSQDYGTYKGYMAENYVAEELISSGFNELFFWKGRTSEIEFLLAHGDSAIPVEVKSGNRTKSKSLKVFCDKYEPQHCIKLSAKKMSLNDKKLNLPLYCTGKLKNILSQLAG